jgi:hypothetical protein
MKLLAAGGVKFCRLLLLLLLLMLLLLRLASFGPSSPTPSSMSHYRSGNGSWEDYHGQRDELWSWSTWQSQRACAWQGASWGAFASAAGCCTWQPPPSSALEASQARKDAKRAAAKKKKPYVVLANLTRSYENWLVKCYRESDTNFDVHAWIESDATYENYIEHRRNTQASNLEVSEAHFKKMQIALIQWHLANIMHRNPIGCRRFLTIVEGREQRAADDFAISEASEDVEDLPQEEEEAVPPAEDEEEEEKPQAAPAAASSSSSPPSPPVQPPGPPSPPGLQQSLPPALRPSPAKPPPVIAAIAGGAADIKMDLTTDAGTDIGVYFQHLFDSTQAWLRKEVEPAVAAVQLTVQEAFPAHKFEARQFGSTVYGGMLAIPGFSDLDLSFALLPLTVAPLQFLRGVEAKAREANRFDRVNGQAIIGLRTLKLWRGKLLIDVTSSVVEPEAGHGVHTTQAVTDIMSRLPASMRLAARAVVDWAKTNGLSPVHTGIFKRLKSEPLQRPLPPLSSGFHNL